MDTGQVHEHDVELSRRLGRRALHTRVLGVLGCLSAEALRCPAASSQARLIMATWLIRILFPVQGGLDVKMDCSCQAKHYPSLWPTPTSCYGSR